MIKLNKWQKMLVVLNVILLVWILTTTDGKNNGYELYAEERNENYEKFELYDEEDKSDYIVISWKNLECKETEWGIELSDNDDIAIFVNDDTSVEIWIRNIYYELDKDYILWRQEDGTYLKGKIEWQPTN